MKMKQLFVILLLLCGTRILAQQDQVKQNSKLSPALSDQLKKIKPKQEQVFIISARNSKLFRDSISKMAEITIISFYEPAGIYFIKTSIENLTRLLGWDNVLFVDVNRKPIEELLRVLLKMQPTW